MSGVWHACLGRRRRWLGQRVAGAQRSVPQRCLLECGAVDDRGLSVRNEFTAIIEQDEDWFIAYAPEIPGANGQGRTKREALQSLAEAIALILDWP